jgi:hypothetical protein
MMAKGRLVLLVAFLALLGGCVSAAPTVAPSDGPVMSDSPTPLGPLPSDFHHKYVYDDGLQIEVTGIRAGHFTASEIQYAATGEKKGDPYVVFTVRVRNGSPSIVDLSSSETVVYGPDGKEAEFTNVPAGSGGGLNGKLLPGRSRTEVFAYLIPDKYQDDVVMEYSADLEHDSALFAGSVK